MQLAPELPTVLGAAFTVTKDGSYRVALADPDGLASRGDTEYFIRVLEDRPPEVHVTKPAGDRSVTRLEEVEIEAEADDDRGIGQLDLVYSVRGGPEAVVPLRVPQRATTVSVHHTFYLEDLDISPGDFVSYYVRARDVTRGARSNETRSDIFFLDIKPFEQEFSLAQSQSMAGGGYAGAIDELVNAQRQVVVATWKLDRRARDRNGPRSEQDVRAVARTEAELKARTEQTASSFRESTMRDPRQRLGGAAPNANQRSEEDAMETAVQAMGRAVTLLDEIKTAQALPHEMTALNGLLKAQAEIKHRQIATNQSAAGGAGNANRNYDVSTLFDRELRRQQQTNYETQQNGDRRTQPDSNTLDKIKDLARRQDELLRRQQQLESEPRSDDDRKRQLEQLTREQSELRQRAEELAREMSSRGDRAARGDAERDGARQMQDVSGSMRQAAADLRRGAPGQAGAARALQQLKDLEARLGSPAANERQRLFGEMQLEARQLADRQRQLAAALARIGQRNSGQDDLRRLAAEQERIAERTRKLQDGLGRQATTGGRDSRDQASPAGDVARQLESQRLADRMKSSADQMRAALESSKGSPQPGANGDPRKQAAVQEEMARQLDRLADRLGSIGGLDDERSRKLSGQLARTQELRDKLEQANRALESAAGQNGKASDAGRRAPSDAGKTGSGRQGAGGADLSRLNEDLLRQLREAKGLLDQLQREDPSFSQNGAGFTLEGQGLTLSAPGTEAFKQDFATWQALNRQASVALERAESTLSRKLQANQSKGRLASGVDDAAPLEYQSQVDAYFKALAGRKK
jgi:hypothetical protein